jgi:hypothetical protein
MTSGYANALRPSWWTALLGVGLVAVLATSGRQEEGHAAPPDIVPGTKIYQIDVTADSRNALASLAVTEPILVKEVRGPWVLVEVPGLPHGAVWLNFEQVVYYRTTPVH